MAKSYKIDLIVNTSQADAATAKAVGEQKRVEDAATRAAMAIEKAAERAAISQEKAAERAAVAQDRASSRAQTAAERTAALQERASERATMMQERAAERAAASQEKAATRAVIAQEKAAERAASAQEKAAARAEAASEKAAAKGERGFTNMALATGLVVVGMQKLVEVAGIYGQAIESAAEKHKKFRDLFISERDKLGELAAVEGKTGDNQYALDFGKFRKQTASTFQEASAFRLDFQNSGAQFIGDGKNISEKEADEFKVQAMQLAVAKHLDPGVVGDAAGNTLGYKNYNQHGEKANEEAMRKLFGGMAILDRGKGKTAGLLKQASRLAAASLNETDEMAGSFKDDSQAYAMTSVMAEYNPAAAEVHARAAIKGLRSFDDEKIGPVLQESGIGAKDNAFDAAKKLTPTLRKMVAEQGNGRTIEDVVRDIFPDERMRTGILTLVNKGVVGGAIDDRLAVAESAKDPAQAQKFLGEYMASEQGAQRVAAAGNDLSRTKVGAESSAVDVLRQQAEERLRDRKEIDTTGADAAHIATGVFSLGTINRRKDQIESEAQKIILERGGSLPDGQTEPYVKLTEEERIKDLNYGIGSIQSNNGSPFGDNIMSGVESKLDENTQQLKELNAKIGVRAGSTPPPMGRPAAPALIGR